MKGRYAIKTVYWARAKDFTNLTAEPFVQRFNCPASEHTTDQHHKRKIRNCFLKGDKLCHIKALQLRVNSYEMGRAGAMALRKNQNCFEVEFCLLSDFEN